MSNKLAPEFLKIVNASQFKNMGNRILNKHGKGSQSKQLNAKLQRALRFTNDNAMNVTMPIPCITSNNEEAIAIVDEINKENNGPADKGVSDITGSLTDVAKLLDKIAVKSNLNCKDDDLKPAKDSDDKQALILEYTNNFNDNIRREVEPEVSKLEKVLNDTIAPSVDSTGNINATGILTPIHSISVVSGGNSLNSLTLSDEHEEAILSGITETVGETVLPMGDNQAVDLFPPVEIKENKPITHDQPKVTIESAESEDRIVATAKDFKNYGSLLTEQFKALSKWLKEAKLTSIYKFRSDLSPICNAITNFLTSTLQLGILNICILVKKCITSSRLFFKSTKDRILNMDGEYTKEVTIMKQGKLTKDEFKEVAESVNKLFDRSSWCEIKGDSLVVSFKYNITIVEQTKATAAMLEIIRKKYATSDDKFRQEVRAYEAELLKFMKNSASSAAATASAKYNETAQAYNDYMKQMNDETNDYVDKLCDELTKGMKDIMDRLLALREPAKNKLKEFGSFIASYLTEESLSALKEKIYAHMDKIETDTVTARDQLLKDFRRANIRCIKKNGKSIGAMLSESIFKPLVTGSDASILFILNLTDEHDATTMLSRFLYDASILSSHGYIHSMERSHRILLKSYDELNTSYEKLKKTQAETPLLGEYGKYVGFVNKMFNVDSRGTPASSLIREAKINHLRMAQGLSNLKGGQVFSALIGVLCPGTSMNATITDAYGKYNKKKQPIADIARLAAMLIDLDTFEKQILTGKVTSSVRRAVSVIGAVTGANFLKRGLQYAAPSVFKHSVSVDRCNSIEQGAKGSGRADIASIVGSVVPVVTGVVASAVKLAPYALTTAMTTVWRQFYPDDKAAVIAFNASTYAALWVAGNALAETLRHRLRLSMPLCVIVECGDHGKLNLPLQQINATGTQFSTITRSPDESFSIEPKNSFIQLKQALQKKYVALDMKAAVDELRILIVKHICDTSSYDDRRNQIFMDDVFTSTSVTKDLFKNRPPMYSFKDYLLLYFGKNDMMFTLEFKFVQFLYMIGNEYGDNYIDFIIEHYQNISGVGKDLRTSARDDSTTPPPPPPHPLTSLPQAAAAATASPQADTVAAAAAAAAAAVIAAAQLAGNIPPAHGSVALPQSAAVSIPPVPRSVALPNPNLPPHIAPAPLAHHPDPAANNMPEILINSNKVDDNILLIISALVKEIKSTTSGESSESDVLALLRAKINQMLDANTLSREEASVLVKALVSQEQFANNNPEQIKELIEIRRTIQKKDTEFEDLSKLVKQLQTDMKRKHNTTISTEISAINSKLIDNITQDIARETALVTKFIAAASNDNAKDINPTSLKHVKPDDVATLVKLISDRTFGTDTIEMFSNFLSEISDKIPIPSFQSETPRKPTTPTTKSLIAQVLAAMQAQLAITEHTYKQMKQDPGKLGEISLVPVLNKALLGQQSAGKCRNKSRKMRKMRKTRKISRNRRNNRNRNRSNMMRSSTRKPQKYVKRYSKKY